MSTGNGKRTAVRLVEISGPAGTVELPNGREADVRAAPAFVVQFWREVQRLIAGSVQEEEHHYDDLCTATRALLPDATEEEYASLTIPMMESVVAISMGHVEAVETVLEQGRNSPKAATRVPKPSSSRRTTRSSTRSNG
jgi:hypothetical protein